jgi:hypothetical protein
VLRFVAVPAAYLLVRLGIHSSRALHLTRFDRPSAARLVSHFAAASTLPPASLNEIR